jgi:hypothetical protein
MRDKLGDGGMAGVNPGGQLADVRKRLDRFAAFVPPLSDRWIPIRRERERLAMADKVGPD